MTHSVYSILQQQVSSSEEVEDVFLSLILQKSSRSIRALVAGVFLLLFASLSCNAISIYQQLRSPSKCSHVTGTSHYAGLLKDVAVPFTIDTPYTSHNRTVADGAWSSPHLLTYSGLVALSDDWARDKNLPDAQRSPWDESKGLYILNGFHNMHCLRMLRRSVFEALDGDSQTIPHEHIAHCLDVLRDDVMCNADDTPRYTGRLHQQASADHPTFGVGQTRLCRDWTKLEQWARERSACYKPINMSDADFPPIERYKFCPNGEVLWP